MCFCCIILFSHVISFKAICYELPKPGSLFIAEQLWCKLFYNINRVLKTIPKVSLKTNVALIK